MAEAYAVAAELTLKSNVAPVLREMIEALDKARRGVVDLQAELDALGRAGRGISAMVRSLSKLSEIRFPAGLAQGAGALEDRLAGAVGKMDALLDRARAFGAEMGRVRPNIPGGGGGVPGGGGRGHGGGDPIIEGIAGGEVLEFYAQNYEKFGRVEQTYRAMQADSQLAGNSAGMRAIRAQAAEQLRRYRTLTPLDIAKNAAEAYTIGGGNLTEQSGIADMLDRAEQNLVLRGKSPEDAQRQAVASVRALDVSNRFFNRQTGEFDLGRANAEMGRVQALISASNGLMTGMQFLAFEKAAGTAGQNLSLEGEARMAHLLDINPSRTGTALRSFESLFGNGGRKMTEKDAAFWASQGIFRNGQTVDADLLRSDPLAWMQAHLGRFDSDTIDTYTQRMNVSSMANEARGSQGNINRQAAAVARSNADANSRNLLNSPQGASLTFEASMNRFEVSLGKFESGPGIKILDALSTGLDKLGAFMSTAPTMSKDFLELSAGLAAFGVLRGAVSLSGLGGSFSLLAKGLSLFTKGAAAEAGLAVLAGTGAGSLLAFGAAIAGLGAVLYGVYRLAHDSPKAAPNSILAPPKPGQKPVREGALPGDDGNMANPLLHREAYVGTPGSVGPLHVTLTLDGRRLATAMVPHLLPSGVHHGTSTWDPSSTALAPGLVPA